MKAKLIIVGGFLGAGKTTMLWRMARHLADQGEKVGLITNDQASELVDTKFLTLSGGVAAEVSGSCFCCNFNGFTDAIASVKDQGISVIIAEPVGSCTDLSATILQPLKEKLADEISLSPFSVMVDAGRLTDILSGGDSGLHKSAAYIVRKQLEEADYIVINKIDLCQPKDITILKEKAAAAFPNAKVFAASAQEDAYVKDWLDQVMAGEAAGTQLLTDIDYDTYAEGEAVLGWLNATIALQGKGVDWKGFMETLLNGLSQRFDGNGQAVGHVKALISEKNNFIVGNVVGKNATLKVRGDSNRDEGVTLTLNARVEMTPQELEDAVKETLAQVAGKEVTVDIQVCKCLQPGRPNPTHRYQTIV